MARAQEKDDSVYDFLYIDARRVVHFLSQFNQYGHLTTLTRSTNETSTSSGGFNVHVAKLDSASSEQTSQTRQFDAQWIAPLSFLDQASQRGMIARGIGEARIGRLVLVTGELSLFDLAMVQTLWGMGPVKDLMLNAMGSSETATETRQHRRSHERKNEKSPQTATDVAFEMLKTLPHAILATIGIGERSVWSSLVEEGMMMSSSNLLLKHGIRIAGEWNMIGVIDAMPDEEDEDSSALYDKQAASLLGALGPIIGGMAPAIRGMLGRPKGAFGMTPLLIFREVSGQ